MLCPILHLRLRKHRPQTPPLRSNSSPSREGRGLAVAECLVLFISLYGKVGRFLDSGQSLLVQSVKVDVCCLLRYLTESFAIVIISGSSCKNTLCRVANTASSAPTIPKSCNWLSSYLVPGSGRPCQNGISACATKTQHQHGPCNVRRSFLGSRASSLGIRRQAQEGLSRPQQPLP